LFREKIMSFWMRFLSAVFSLRVSSAALVLGVLLSVGSISLGMDLQEKTYVSYGDSITASWAVVPPEGYATLIANDAHATLQNRAIGGQTACMMARSQIFSQLIPSLAKGSTYTTMMIGTNDAFGEGAGPYESIYKMCLRASISWLAVPDTHKALANTSACSKSGRWSADPTASVHGLQSGSQGDMMTCELVTDGAPLFIWFEPTDASDGVFSYAVDAGPSKTSSVRTSVPIRMHDGRGLQGAAAIEMTGLKPGVHKVTIKVESASSPKNRVKIFGIGTPAPLAERTLRVFVGGVPFQINNETAVSTKVYYDIVKSTIDEFRSIGLPVEFVETRKYLLGQPNEMHDNLHPNPLGHMHLRDAFEAKILSAN
jgi:lysophospholipase L1-like esterase